MDIKSFVYCVENLTSDVSVLSRGGHGIGKSAVVAQLAKKFGLPLIDKRLSQLSEGDMIGLPVIKDGVTTFAHPDWFIQACEEPCMLFFDELNRALPEVMQAAFQIVLDRQLNGRKLHENTRVYAAINNSAIYQVNEMDPALLDRFWVADLSPTVEDWIEWAKKPEEEMGGGIHPYMINFVQGCKVDAKSGQSILDPTGKNPGDIEPSRRSYERLDKVTRKMGLYDIDLSGDKNPALQNLFMIAQGFIGNNCANQFTQYLKDMERQVTAEDILNDWNKAKKRVEGMGQEKWNMCIEKVVEYGRNNVFTDAQAKNFGKFIKVIATASGELVIHTWTELAKEPNSNSQANIKIIHPHIVNHILPIFGKKAQAEKEEDKK